MVLNQKEKKKKAIPDGTENHPAEKKQEAEDENRLDLLQWYLKMIIDSEPEKKR